MQFTYINIYIDAEVGKNIFLLVEINGVYLPFLYIDNEIKNGLSSNASHNQAVSQTDSIFVFCFSPKKRFLLAPFTCLFRL